MDVGRAATLRWWCGNGRGDEKGRRASPEMRSGDVRALNPPLPCGLPDGQDAKAGQLVLKAKAVVARWELANDNVGAIRL